MLLSSLAGGAASAGEGPVCWSGWQEVGVAKAGCTPIDTTPTTATPTTETPTTATPTTEGPTETTQVTPTTEGETPSTEAPDNGNVQSGNVAHAGGAQPVTATATYTG